MLFYRNQIRKVIFGAVLFTNTIASFTTIAQANQTTDLSIIQDRSLEINLIDPALSAVPNLMKNKDLSAGQNSKINEANDSIEHPQLIAKKVKNGRGGRNRRRGRNRRGARNSEQDMNRRLGINRRQSINRQRATPKRLKGIPSEAREIGRQMAANPKNSRYRLYKNNTTPKLPATKHGEYYLEERVDIGTRKGAGQHRVVVLVDNQGKVQKKYYTPNHYGTGHDADRKPTWTEFQ